MLILFSLIVMRMSGAIALNPMFGRTNLPSAAKAGFVFLLSLLLYTTGGAGLYREPATMLEYGVMLLLELFVGFTLGFAMELSVMVVRFASSAMDYVMGVAENADLRLFAPDYVIAETGGYVDDAVCLALFQHESGLDRKSVV